jgi:thiol-disulfide isomerase/thioredoxin
VGAAYEVQAQALAEQHRSAEAIQLLRNAMHRWSGTSIVTRLQKNVNLLTLVGKPMPALRVPEWIGGTRPATAGALRGKVVMLFFWAHWCPDCKAEAPVLAKVAAEFEPKGLVVIAPTERYGYTPSDEHALPAEEKAFIEKVFDRFYAEIPKVQVPLDSGNFQRFGASTTPTLVLVDRKGVVRLYHPGVMDEASLRSAVQSLINS